MATTKPTTDRSLLGCYGCVCAYHNCAIGQHAQGLVALSLSRDPEYIAKPAVTATAKIESVCLLGAVRARPWAAERSDDRSGPWTLIKSLLAWRVRPGRRPGALSAPGLSNNKSLVTFMATSLCSFWGTWLFGIIVNWHWCSPSSQSPSLLRVWVWVATRIAAIAIAIRESE